MVFADSQEGPRIKVNGVEARWQTLVELIEDNSRTVAPDGGIEVEGVYLSYPDLCWRAQRVAANLRNQGIARGDCVASLMLSRIEVLLTWFGTVMAGGIWAPFNSSLVGQDLLTTLRDAKPRFLVTDAESASKFADSAIAPYVPERRFIVGGEAVGFEPFERLLDPSAIYEPLPIAPSDPAIVIYTGGTTGLPKGVVLPHFACLCGGYRYVECFSVTAADRHYATSTLFHTGGLLVGILGPMVAGMRTIFDRQFSVSNYWNRVRETQATIISPVGIALTLLCRQPPSPHDRNHRVRASLGVTGQLPENVPSEFSNRFGIPLANVYSLTEASGALTFYNPPGSAKPDANGTGRHWADVAVVDNVGQPLPCGQLGKIVLRPKVPFTFMLGYHNNPAATVKAFTNLWLNTGDLGFLDEQGFLHFRGREAHWLRRRGENISAYEVESIISKFPGIAEVTVVGVPSELGEEEVKAFIVPESGRNIDFVELSYWCLDRMASFKIPRFFEIVQQFPRSATKREVERHVLRQLSNAAAWDRELALGRRMQRRVDGRR